MGVCKKIKLFSHAHEYCKRKNQSLVQFHNHFSLQNHSNYLIEKLATQTMPCILYTTDCVSLLKKKLLFSECRVKGLSKLGF